MDNLELKVAVLDLYNGVENQGMRCIKQILRDCDRRFDDVRVSFTVFDVRAKAEVPGMEFDVYISSGGPGSPYDGDGELWERKYFQWLDNLWRHNKSDAQSKFLLSICHSFQMLCRHFDFAEVVIRKSGSFGIMPVHLTEEGQNDPLFSRLSNPFYAADFREWQILQPNEEKIRLVGASILAIEKERPHVPLERAVMAMRLSDFVVGTQFHPEADPEGMYHHFTNDVQREKITDTHGEEKFNQIIHRLTGPEYLLPTYQNFIPEFIRTAVEYYVGTPSKVR